MILEYYVLTRTLWVVGYVVAFYLRWKHGMAFSRDKGERSAQVALFYGGFLLGWLPWAGEGLAFYLLCRGIWSACSYYEQSVEERVGAIEKKRRIDKLLAENPDKAGNLSLTDQE